MKIEIPYGKHDVIQVQIPKEQIASISTPNQVTSPDQETIVHKALEQPIEQVPFKQFVSEAKNILIIVNDSTRPTPTAKVMEDITDQLKGKAIKIICATGAHRGPTEDEWKEILGKTYETYKNNLLVHDAKNDKMIHLGASKIGTEIYLNQEVMEADKIIVIGSVEPHYFAGYTGGRKAFLPGTAGYETIEQNHKYALSPKAGSLALAENPVHEDMVDALSYLKAENIFSIQAVLEQHRRIFAITAGHICGSFDAAVEAAHKVFCVDFTECVDIVISVAPYPMDIDLYQSQKAIDNGKLALKSGGILILVAECRDGIGGATFYRLLSSYEEPKEVLKKIGEEYKLGYHKAAKIAEIAIKSNIWAVSKLDAEQLKNIFIQKKNSLQEAIDEALQISGPNARVMVLPEGSITVPRKV